MTKVIGTPDSFLVLNVFKDPDNVLAYLKTVLPPESSSNKQKPDRVFFSDQNTNNDSLSLAYLRCPSINDVLPFTPEIKEIVNTIDPNTNIVKILRYVDGKNSLKAHCDKTIDLDDIVPIYNVRLGSPRKFILKHKVTGDEIATVIPHNAMFVLGLKTNSEYTHSIPEEDNITSYTYSIILRKSVTFKDVKTGLLWGTRTYFPTHSELVEYVEKNANTKENTAENKNELIKLWGMENKHIVDHDHYNNYCSQSVE